MLKRNQSSDYELNKNSKKQKSLNISNDSIQILETSSDSNDSYQTASNNSIDHTDVSSSEQTAIETIKKSLRNTNYSIGDFSVSGEIINEPSFKLELNIKNLSLKSTIINDSQYSELIKLSSHTIDTNNHQFDPNEFEIKNQNWSNHIQTIIDHISNEFHSTNQTINAKLDKLILQKSGSHLLKQTEPLKDNKIFAKLLMQLPCDYKGGQFIVYKAETKNRFKFGESKQNKSSIYYTAFYSDLQYDLLEVTSGYRFILFYSLYSNETIDYFKIKNKQINELSTALKEITHLEKPLAIILEHKYTDATIRESDIDLKGIDRDRFQILKKANLNLPKEEQFCIYIARAQLNFDDEYYVDDSESDQEYYPIEDPDVDDEKCGHFYNQIANWHDISGKCLINFGLDFNRVRLDYFSKIIDLDNDTDDRVYKWRYSRWCRRTYFHRFLLTFWPQKLNFKFFSQISAEKAIDINSKQVLISSNPLDCLDDLLNKLNNTTSEPWELFKNEDYEQMFSVLTDFKDASLFIERIQPIASECLITNIIYNLWKDRMVGINCFKWTIKELIKKFSYNNEYHDKQLEMVNQSKDTMLIKLFIKKCIILYCKYTINQTKDINNDIFIEQAIDLITSNKWAINENLFDFLQPVDAENIEYNCVLTQGFYDFNQKEIAVKCLQTNILPILELENEFNRIEKLDIYFKIINLMISNDNLDKEMIKFKSLIIAKNDPKIYQVLFQNLLLIKNIKHKLSTPLLELITHRLKYLKQMQRDLKLNWKMDAKLSIKPFDEFASFRCLTFRYEHIEFENFLNSEQETMVYYGGELHWKSSHFKTKPQAQKFADAFSGLRDGFSTRITVFGKKDGNPPYVFIVKTNEYFESIRRIEKIELDSLESLIQFDV